MSSYEEDLEVDSDDFELDEFNLEKETGQQASLTYKYGLLHSRAKYKVDRIKISLDIARAEVSKEVRGQYEEYGLNQQNEGAIKTIVEAMPRIVKLKKRLAKYLEENNIAYAAINAINAKKSSIDAQVRLYAMSYYSDKQTTTKSTSGGGAVKRRGKRTS